MPKVYNRRGSHVVREHIPADAVYVGRPTKWGNPYKEGVDGTREEVVAKFREDLLLDMADGGEWSLSLAELRGKDLVCWCAPKLCHADVLLEYANDA